LAMQFCAQGEHLPVRPEYAPGGRIESLIGPIVAGGTFNGTARPQTTEHKPVPWSADAVPPTGTAQMYIWGFIKYNDGFSFGLMPPHVTGFCARYHPQEYPSMSGFAGCDEANYRYGN
jgi:hypothetical protein